MWGVHGGSVNWAVDLISTQVMISGLWDQAPHWALHWAWSLLTILSISLCSSPHSYVCSLTLFLKKEKKIWSLEIFITDLLLDCYSPIRPRTTYPDGSFLLYIYGDLAQSPWKEKRQSVGQKEKPSSMHQIPWKYLWSPPDVSSNHRCGNLNQHLVGSPATKQKCQRIWIIILSFPSHGAKFPHKFLRLCPCAFSYITDLSIIISTQEIINCHPFYPLASHSWIQIIAIVTTPLIFSSVVSTNVDTSFFFFKDLFIYLRERRRAQVGEGSERQEEKSSSRFPAEHRAWSGAQSQDTEIIIWTKIESQMLNQRSYPDTPINIDTS